MTPTNIAATSTAGVRPNLAIYLLTVPKWDVASIGIAQTSAAATDVSR
jgi:hypothetical protein